VSDIVERLRRGMGVGHEQNNRMNEAADEIERLRDRLADYEDAHRTTVDDCGAPDEKHCSCVPSLRLEIERLRALIPSDNYDGPELAAKILRQQAEIERLRASLAAAYAAAKNWENEAAMARSRRPTLDDLRAEADPLDPSISRGASRE